MVIKESNEAATPCLGAKQAFDCDQKQTCGVLTIFGKQKLINWNGCTHPKFSPGWGDSLIEVPYYHLAGITGVGTMSKTRKGAIIIQRRAAHKTESEVAGYTLWLNLDGKTMMDSRNAFSGRFVFAGNRCQPPSLKFPAFLHVLLLSTQPAALQAPFALSFGWNSPIQRLPPMDARLKQHQKEGKLNKALRAVMLCSSTSKISRDILKYLNIW